MYSHVLLSNFDIKKRCYFFVWISSALKNGSIIFKFYFSFRVFKHNVKTLYIILILLVAVI